MHGQYQTSAITAETGIGAGEEKEAEALRVKCDPGGSGKAGIEYRDVPVTSSARAIQQRYFNNGFEFFCRGHSLTAATAIGLGTFRYAVRDTASFAA